MVLYVLRKIISAIFDFESLSLCFLTSVTSSPSLLWIFSHEARKLEQCSHVSCLNVLYYYIYTQIKYAVYIYTHTLIHSYILSSTFFYIHTYSLSSTNVKTRTVCTYMHWYFTTYEYTHTLQIMTLTLNNIHTYTPYYTRLYYTNTDTSNRK